MLPLKGSGCGLSITEPQLSSTLVHSGLSVSKSPRPGFVLQQPRSKRMPPGEIEDMWSIYRRFSKHFRSISEPWFCFPMARHWRQGIMRLTMPESILGDIHVIGGRCGSFQNVTFWKALIWWSGWIRTTRTAASFHDISCASIIGATEACDLGKRNHTTMLYQLYRYTFYKSFSGL